MHKAEQRVPLKPTHAPFWSRDMARYRMTYVPLPLDGVAINAELAATFRPVNNALISVPMTASSSYQETFVTPLSAGPPKSLKPSQSRHTSAESHLLICDSASHREFPAYASKFVKKQPSAHSLIPKPSSGALPFQCTTSYGDQFIAENSHEPTCPPLRPVEDSSRVFGGAVPGRVKRYLQENHKLSDIPPILEIIDS